MDVSHPDFEMLDQIRRELLRLADGEEELRKQLPIVISDAFEYVVDPVRTARTTLADLDNVEKTFVGLKVEHFFRDFIGLPKGTRDLVVDGVDVDIKHSFSQAWMIPKETYRNADPCLLFATASEGGTCSLGLIRARDEYLNAPNRDLKRGVGALGKRNILWLIQDERLPESRWLGINMMRFRELRGMRGGNKRVAQFFRENIGRIVHRNVVMSLLFNQKDYMKRLRKNGGARDLLNGEGILLLSGAFDRELLAAHGLSECGRDQWVAVRKLASGR